MVERQGDGRSLTCRWLWKIAREPQNTSRLLAALTGALGGESHGQLAHFLGSPTSRMQPASPWILSRS
eukprot:2947315-Pyramimonas_sp.AAC.1